MKTKIIIIDPDRRTERLINGILKDEYDVLSAFSFSEGYSLITTGSPDIIILDPLYPEKEGLTLIESVREWSDCPIIAVSSNISERAAVAAINAGADDYIRKPFFSSELKARIAGFVRRITVLEAAKGLNTGSIYTSGGLMLEYNAHKVTVNGANVHLTKNEFKILSLLCRHSGKVLTYDFILKSVWGPRTDDNTGILRVNITNLRRKLEKNPLSPQYIHTENGVGYKVNESESE